MRRPGPSAKRGPKPFLADGDLLPANLSILSDPPFLGEGYRKVYARLGHVGIRADRERIRNLMREHSLQTPGRPRRELGPQVHDGMITTSMPDQVWGTDATRVLPRDGRQAMIFGIYDQCIRELMGIHAALGADRFEDITTLQQAARKALGSSEKAITAGLKLRHDNGSQFVSHAFQAEL